jgi:5-methylcytosine-specific restriction endonuclease McrA
MANCTITGKSYSQNTIDSNLSKAYKEFYLFEPKGSCEGCGKPATCTAHIVPKARCKHLHLTSLIWNPENWFRSCYKCNMIAENPSSDEIKNLMNYDTILRVTEKYDKERYEIMIYENNR